MTGADGYRDRELSGPAFWLLQRIGVIASLPGLPLLFLVMPVGDLLKQLAWVLL